MLLKSVLVPAARGSVSKNTTLRKEIKDYDVDVVGGSAQEARKPTRAKRSSNCATRVVCLNVTLYRFCNPNLYWPITRLPNSFSHLAIVFPVSLNSKQILQTHVLQSFVPLAVPTISSLLFQYFLSDKF